MNHFTWQLIENCLSKVTDTQFVLLCTYKINALLCIIPFLVYCLDGKSGKPAYASCTVYIQNWITKNLKHFFGHSQQPANNQP